jgi:transcriptional regulator GlxA family with amidase domain
MRYVWQQRVAAGIELLKHSGLSIGTITERSGFESRFHFSRRIKQATSMAPHELRKAYWSVRRTRLESSDAAE